MLQFSMKDIRCTSVIYHEQFSVELHGKFAFILLFLVQTDSSTDCNYISRSDLTKTQLYAVKWGHLKPSKSAIKLHSSE